MLKKFAVSVLAFVMMFGSISASAEGFVASNVISLAREAQHYYNTRVDYTNMTVMSVNENLYEVYSYGKGNELITLQLYKTDWGTWNLGNMNVTSQNITKTVIGGGTDWEYVFRVYNPINQNLEFTGGNHASEKLVSFRMYDDVTGSEINLASGEAAYANRLVIEEKTQLLLANLEYMPYADVTRVYTIVGDSVNLDCKISFTREVQMAQSYSAMACINKNFSRYVNFGRIMQVTTSPSGLFSNQYSGHVAASECELSGDDPALSVTVGIFNEKDMTGNFVNRDKTFIWDMNEGYNKLYFSRYNLTTLEKVEKDTVWNFGAFWRINLK